MLLFVALMLMLLYFFDRFFKSQPLRNNTEVTFIIDSGQSLQAALNACEKNQLCAYRSWWYWRFRLTRQTIKAGEYLFLPGDNHADLVKRLSTGQSESHQITIIPGQTVYQTWHRLCQLKDIICPNTFNHDALSRQLALPYLEGQLLPETYTFSKGVSIERIFLEAHRALQKHLVQIWDEAVDDVKAQLGSPEALLILASLIEKETSYELEKPYIAGVLMGRLADRMRLQVDPTRTYQPLMESNTLEFDTYDIQGLPPTPIALLSLSSLRAAAHPQKTDARYYVATKNGHHIFSQTYAQHRHAIAKYRP